MIILKLYYHIAAIIKKILYKIIYGKHIKFGKKVTFRKGFSLIIEDSAYVIIDDGCFFNNYCTICAKSGIKIGKNSLFGENVKIYDNNHIFKYKNILIKEQGYKKENIEIGDNCWIGSNTVILKGSSIGNNTVVSAGEVVKEKIEDSCVYSDKKIKKIIYENMVKE